MDTVAVVLDGPQHIALRRLDLLPMKPDDVVVEVEFSGISTGTEKLLWTGRMPPFPGMGYPLVPGYESVGRVVEAGPEARLKPGARVFVPGASCYRDARGLFGGTARRLVVPERRVVPLSQGLGERGVLISLAATALHAIAGNRGAPPELIVGHGVLGRLIARVSLALGNPAPVVWEVNPARLGGAEGYRAIHPDTDERHDYRAIHDASGDGSLLDALIGRLGRGGEIVLAGFYEKPISFTFPPAFMKEARLRIAAEFNPSDLAETAALIEAGRLSLDGLITHRRDAADAEGAYRTAFEDPACLKMIIDWSDCA